MQRVLIQIATLVVAGLVLVGCTTSSEPVETVSDGGASPIEESPTPTPTQMSDEEALQIGVDTFERLLAAELDMIRTKGQSIDEFDALITENLNEYRENVVETASKGYSAHGELKVYLPKLQRASKDRIAFYGCLKMDEGYVTDSSGAVVGGDREGQIGSVEIHVVKDREGDWRVDRKVRWDDPDHCSSLRS